MNHERVEWHLENWANWSRSYRPALGLPSRALALASNSSRDFDEMCDEADSYAAKVTEAAIENLVPAEAAAVYRKWDICSVYRFPRHNFIEMYTAALQKLAISLDAQGLV